MEKVECFLCMSLEMINLNISNTLTKYQKLPITSILHNFAGNDRIEIVITNADIICCVCKRLLDELDLMRTKLQNIENIVVHKLHRKYRFNDIERKLPAIQLDEPTTNLYILGNDNHKFQCVQCPFSTNFQDCLFPHLLHHQCADIDSAQPTDDFACENCRIILPSKVLFNQHMTTFHISQNTHAEQNQIDWAHGDDDHNTHKVNDQIQENLFQCLVSPCSKFQKSYQEHKTVFKLLLL